jgi:hypothetical protein
MSYRGDLKKIVKAAEAQGWRVEKRKEYWMFFPPDKALPPCRVAGTPSSQTSWRNFLSCMKGKGYKS